MTPEEFNDLTSSREKWDNWESLGGVLWRCPGCKAELSDGPYRASPFHGAEVCCSSCDTILTTRTGGGQSDPFRWVAEWKPINKMTVAELRRYATVKGYGFTYLSQRKKAELLQLIREKQS